MIWQHSLFDVPAHYGNAAYFFTLKPEYSGPENKSKLIGDIYNRDLNEKEVLPNDFRNNIGILTVTGAILGTAIGTILASCHLLSS